VLITLLTLAVTSGTLITAISVLLLGDGSFSVQKYVYISNYRLYKRASDYREDRTGYPSTRSTRTLRTVCAVSLLVLKLSRIQHGYRAACGQWRLNRGKRVTFFCFVLSTTFIYLVV
jgi:hypothetical protein